MTEEESKMFFEKMSGYPPKLENLNYDLRSNVKLSTSFYEDLYQAFRARMKAEDEDHRKLNLVAGECH